MVSWQILKPDSTPLPMPETASVLVDGTPQLADLKAKVLELYAQGVHYKEIAQKLVLKPTTVRTWALRAGLVKPRPDSNSVKPDAPNHNSQVRNNLGKALVRASDKLEKLAEPKSPKAIKLHAELVKSLAEPASMVFGWSQSSTTTLLSITSYTDVDQLPAQDVIDVTPTALPSTPQALPEPTPTPQAGNIEK